MSFRMDPPGSAHLHIVVRVLTDFYLPISLHRCKDVEAAGWAARWFWDQLDLGVLGLVRRFVASDDCLGLFC